MKHTAAKRLLSLLLTLAMLMSLCVTGVYAEESGSQGLSYTKLQDSETENFVSLANGEEVEESIAALYEEDEMVRVTIVMEAQPATVGVGEELSLEAQREQLKAQQMEVAQAISDEALDGEALETVWNLTLVANAISANVEYGKIKEIEKVDGVAAVILETRYMPLGNAETTNIVSQTMTGASTVQTSGYTGAGTRIAIIDTGVDTDHQSFAAAPFEYALSQLDGEYDLLDVDKINEVLTQLHAYELDPYTVTYDSSGNAYSNEKENYTALTAEDLYVSSKIPFGYNYVDHTLDITHDNDDQGEHGSHVAGIAAANRYIAADKLFTVDNAYDFDGDKDFDVDDVQALMNYIINGTKIDNANRADISGDGVVTDYDAHLFLDLLDQQYVSAAEQVGVTGVAPDAQIIAMKVFGQNGGAYQSDYMAAIEDAVTLGCDTINLSLGAAYPGFSHSYTYEWYDEVTENLANTGVVVCVSAGNDYNWATYDGAYGMMYADEGGTTSTTDPSTYGTTMSVASADNIGAVSDMTIAFGGNGAEVEVVFSAETVSSGNNESWSALDPEYHGESYEAVFLGDPTALLTGGEQTDSSIYAGDESDFAGYDFTGKVVLVARGGEVSFADKHMNAALAKAAAVVIYNNVDGTIYASLDGSTATIPCGVITLDEAKNVLALCDKDENGIYSCTISVVRGLTVDEGDENAFITMSDFSSWGAIGDLSIKPEITAPGGGIYSVNGLDQSGSAYETMSGTSMAAPHAAGIAALAAQYVKESGVAGTQVRKLVQSLMMSTAKPLIEEASGVEYSVRKQGAGLVNIQSIVNAQSHVYVDGQSDGKVKAELGDGTQDRTFSFTLYNDSSSATTFDLSASILTPATVTVDGYQLSSDSMTTLDANVSFSTGSSVTVAANSSKTVTVTISIPETTAEKMEKLGHTNGFYIEGYVYAVPQADAEGVQDVTHSIPLLGWYGNWTDISMYDTGSYTDYYYDDVKRPSHITEAMDTSGYAVDTTQKNMLAWTLSNYNYPMAYSGNVYNGGNIADGSRGGDSSYIEARNSINVTSDRYFEIYGIFPTLIRNGVDADLVITDGDGNELYRDDLEGYAMYANFYYSGYGTWLDFTTSSGFTIENWDWAAELEDGTELNLSLGILPEYYVDDAKYFDSFEYNASYGASVFTGYEVEDDWWTDGTIGDGAFLSYTFTVDNTAPDLADVENPLSYEDGKLTFAVQDNRYVAAVILLDGNGETAVEYYYPDMDEDEEGKSVTGSFDLTDYTGSRAVLAICDYAGNETYYAVNLTGEQGSSYADLVAFQYGDGWYNDYAAWVTFDRDVNKNEITLYNEDLVEMVAAEYVNGYIFAQDSNGKLYGINYQDFLAGAITDLETTYITTLDNVYQDFAYSYKEGKLYGLLTTKDGDDYPTSEIVSINLNGSYWDDDLWKQVEAYDESSAVSRGGLEGLAMAIDDAGTVYVLGCTYDWDTAEMSETAHLWSVGVEYNEWTYQWELGWKMSDIGDTGLPMNYLQSMTWDHNDEALYWAQFSDPKADITLQKVEVVTDEDTEKSSVKCTKVGTLQTETCAMFAPLTAVTAAKEAHATVPKFDSSEIGTPILSAHSLTMGKNTTQNLSVNFEPWYTGRKSVVWSSDDESVATVNQNGKVTAVGEGKCTITVANTEDETKFDTCEITVAAISANIEGIVSYAPENVMNFSDSRHYDFTVDAGVADMELGEGLSFSDELSEAFKEAYGEDADISQSYSLDISAATLGRDGYLWVSEGTSNGMFYKVDPETMEVVEILEPIGGDFTYSVKYNEKNDTFSTVSNYWMFTNMDMDEEMYDKLHEMVNNGEDYTTYHRVDLSSVLAYSDTGFATGENTGVNYDLDIVVSAMEIIHEPYTQEWEDNYKDFMGNWDYNVSGANYAGIQYTTDTTYVLLDNVGRLWYIDEIPGFKIYEYEYEDTDWSTGETFIATTTYYYTADDLYLAYDGEGMMFESSNLPKGMIFMEDVDESGNRSATCYYVRELVETPLTDMYRVGTMPRISYHYCDLYYAGTIDGAPAFFMSLYDFHNEGKTNQFYLYVGGKGTGEWGYDDDYNYVELMTDPVIYELGNSGDYRVLALITKAEYLGGLPGSASEEADPAATAGKSYVGRYNYRSR